MDLRDFFFQIILFLGAAIIGISVPMLPQQSQKKIASTFAGLAIIFAILWTGFEIGQQRKSFQDNSQVVVPYIIIPTQDSSLNITSTLTQTISPTFTAETIFTQTEQPATNTVSPTDTPIPTQTPIADTEIGSILEVGQEWRQNGVGLRLTRFNFDPTDTFYYGVNVGFEFRNYTNSDLIFSYTDRDFIAFTNSGNSLYVRGFYNRSFWCPDSTAEVKAGGRFSLEDDVCGVTKGYLLNIEANLGDPNLTEIIVHVTQLSRISDARWRIPVNH